MISKNLIQGKFYEQLAINFISSKDTDEERVMHSKSDNIEFMITLTQMKLLKNLFNHFLIDIKLDWKHQ